MTAARTKLAPGEDSIDRVDVNKRKDGIYVIHFSVCLWSGRLVRGTRTGRTAGEAKTSARAFAAERLSEAGGGWKQSSLLSEYIEKVALPSVDSEPDLTPATRSAYRQASKWLLGDCDEHPHADSLAGMAIGQANHFRPLEAVVRDVISTHGYPAGKHARSFLSKYVWRNLRRDGLAEHYPLRGVGFGKAPARSHGGRALSPQDYNRVIDWLMALDPADGIRRRQGRWSIEHLVQVQRNAIDVTLLQSVTGLRISEANQILWSDMVLVNKVWHVDVRPEVSKTKVHRRVPVLDATIAERIMARRHDAPDDGFVIGSPTNPGKRWEAGNCRKKTTALCQRIHSELKVDVFETERTHVWRATLNSLLLDVPEVVRSAFFGHDEAVNRASYTDTRDTSGMVTAAKALRKTQRKQRKKG